MEWNMNAKEIIGTVLRLREIDWITIVSPKYVIN